LSGTLVLQSHRLPLPHPWLRDCIASVERWCADNGYRHHFLDEEVFAPLPPALRDKLRQRPVIASDLARLRWLQRYRDQGWRRVLWLDADVLVLDPGAFRLPDTATAAGREVWIDHDDRGRLRSWRKTHNAFLMFGPGDSLLDFYADSAERLLLAIDGPIPPQFIGPKLLTALHSLSRFPVLEAAAMFSPLLLRDLLGERAASGAIGLFLERSDSAPAAANLCCSSVNGGQLDDRRMQQAIERLLEWRGLSPR
jgi:hypothetical protein